jgi:superfamily II RNA helicase
MEHPLQPLRDQTNPGVLLEHFLDYVTSRSLALYPAQEEAILEVFAGNSVILNTPTGSGKSLVAAAMHFYSASRGRRSVYTCPIKALVNEKFLALCRDFGPENVGMMTGDASVNRDAPILCCTAEILANIAARDGELAHVHDVIMDEFHYYADPERGVAWQIPLLTLPQCRFMLISATMGETHFFAREIEKHTKATCKVVSGLERPVPLEFEYWERTLKEALDKLFDQGKVPVYIVHFTQKAATESAQNLWGMSASSKEDKERIDRELESVSFNSPFGKEIKRLLRNGIGLHHAGLLPKYRVLVERFAQMGLLKVICGTDTLGVGVNVPIRTVLFTQLFKYGGKKTAILNARDFHQISGRAGRKGFDNIGYVVSLAPEYVVQNLRMEAKAANDPKAKKKMVKLKPPEKGFVSWNEATFQRLQTATPEPLVSRFQVNHALLLNMLSRKGDGCAALRQLIRDCHENPASKSALRKTSFQLFRSLLERNIIEMLPKHSRIDGRKLRVNLELQDDFSLNQTLALYLIDTLALLDPADLAYALKVLTLVESILEDPDVILNRQLDKLKSEKVAEMKAAGIEYDERMERLQELEYPKPEREFIYSTFNAFAAEHPWVGKENIRPKSIVREMYETYSNFSDYIKEYGLERAEGLLLRHLGSVYRVLEHTIPPVFRTEALEEVIAFVEHLIRHTDSSLLDEWERLRNPEYLPAIQESSLPANVTDPTRHPERFRKMVREQLFFQMRLLAGKRYIEALEDLDWSAALPASVSSAEPPNQRLEKLMQAFWNDRPFLRLDPEARAKANTLWDEDQQDGCWIVEQLILDGADRNDWSLRVEVDLSASRKQSKVVMRVISIGPL